RLAVEELPREGPQLLPVLRVGEGELDEGAEVTLEIADVEPALARRQAQAPDLAPLADQQPDGVGQLNLAALARRGPREGVEDGRAEDVARRHRQVARRLGDGRLLDD